MNKKFFVYCLLSVSLAAFAQPGASRRGGGERSRPSGGGGGRVYTPGASHNPGGGGGGRSWTPGSSNGGGRSWSNPGRSSGGGTGMPSSRPSWNGPSNWNRGGNTGESWSRGNRGGNTGESWSRGSRGGNTGESWSPGSRGGNTGESWSRGNRGSWERPTGNYQPGNSQPWQRGNSGEPGHPRQSWSRSNSGTSFWPSSNGSTRLDRIPGMEGGQRSSSSWSRGQLPGFPSESGGRSNRNPNLPGLPGSVGENTGRGTRSGNWSRQPGGPGSASWNNQSWNSNRWNHNNWNSSQPRGAYQPGQNNPRYNNGRFNGNWNQPRTAYCPPTQTPNCTPSTGLVTSSTVTYVNNNNYYYNNGWNTWRSCYWVPRFYPYYAISFFPSFYSPWCGFSWNWRWANCYSPACSFVYYSGSSFSGAPTAYEGDADSILSSGATALLTGAEAPAEVPPGTIDGEGDVARVEGGSGDEAFSFTRNAAQPVRTFQVEDKVVFQVTGVARPQDAQTVVVVTPDERSFLVRGEAEQLQGLQQGRQVTLWVTPDAGNGYRLRELKWQGEGQQRSSGLPQLR